MEALLKYVKSNPVGKSKNVIPAQANENKKVNINCIFVAILLNVIPAQARIQKIKPK